MHDRGLTELDAGVEAEQRADQLLRRQAEIDQHAREAEAVQQAERERDGPARIDGADDVVERRGDDADSAIAVST